MFSLIYIEKSNSSDTQSALNGPFCFAEKKDAIKKVFEYAVERILSCCASFLAESDPALAGLAEKVEGCTEEEAYVKVQEYLDGISDEYIMEEITDWYFEYANDDLVEAYYSVNVLDVIGSNPDESLSFTLRDETTGPEGDVSGSVSDKSSLGLCISVNGYSTCSSVDDEGCLVYIEKYDDKLQVRIYGDISKEEPTHNISLEGARNSLRLPDSE